MIENKEDVGLLVGNSSLNKRSNDIFLWHFCSTISGRQHRKSIKLFFFREFLSKFYPLEHSWNAKRPWMVFTTPTMVSFRAVVCACRYFKRRNTGDRSQGCCVTVDGTKYLFWIMHSDLSSASRALNIMVWSWGMSPSNQEISFIHSVICLPGFHPNC